MRGERLLHILLTGSLALIPSNKKMTDSKQNSLYSKLKLLLFFAQLYQVILIGSQWSHAWISKRSKANRRSVVHTG